MDLSIFSREARNGHYEKSDQGIYLPKSKVHVGGVFTHDVRRNGELLGAASDHNTVVDEGLDHILSVIFNGGTAVATWYLGIYDTSYPPQTDDTGADIAASASESSDYDEAVTARPAWVEAAPSGQSITNSANKATFTMSATTTIYGGFLISTSAVNDTAGTLMSASLFSAARSVIDNDELLLTYTFSAADA